MGDEKKGSKVGVCVGESTAIDYKSEKRQGGLAYSIDIKTIQLQGFASISRIRIVFWVS
jgi:hypothetical protein